MRSEPEDSELLPLAGSEHVQSGRGPNSVAIDEADFFAGFVTSTNDPHSALGEVGRLGGLGVRVERRLRNLPDPSPGYPFALLHGEWVGGRFEFNARPNAHGPCVNQCLQVHGVGIPR